MSAQERTSRALALASTPYQQSTTRVSVAACMHLTSDYVGKAPGDGSDVWQCPDCLDVWCEPPG